MIEWNGQLVIPKQEIIVVILIKIGQREVKEMLCLKELRIYIVLEIEKEPAINHLLEVLEIVSPVSEEVKKIETEKEAVSHNSKEQVYFQDLVKVQ